MPDPSDWRVPMEVDSIVVGTLSNPKQAGRPRMKRVQAGADVADGSVGRADGVIGVDVSSVDVGAAEVVEAVGDSGAPKDSRECS